MKFKIDPQLLSSITYALGKVEVEYSFTKELECCENHIAISAFIFRNYKPSGIDYLQYISDLAKFLEDYLRNKNLQITHRYEIITETKSEMSSIKADSFSTFLSLLQENGLTMKSNESGDLIWILLKGEEPKWGTPLFNHRTFIPIK